LNLDIYTSSVQLRIDVFIVGYIVGCYSLFVMDHIQERRENNYVAFQGPAMKRVERERIELAVGDVLKTSELEPEDLSWLQGQCVNLLRRELATERARVRRIVNALSDNEHWQDNYGYLQACQDLLAALSGRKGTR